MPEDEVRKERDEGGDTARAAPAGGSVGAVRQAEQTMPQPQSLSASDDNSETKYQAKELMALSASITATDEEPDGMPSHFAAGALRNAGIKPDDLITREAFISLVEEFKNFEVYSNG